MTNIEHFSVLLNDLHDDSLEIRASALISEDGIMVASHLKKEGNEDRMAAMSAAMLSVSDRMAENLLGGSTNRVMIQNDLGYVIVSSVSDDMLLTVVTCSDAKLGMIFHDINNFAKKLQSSVA